jgi:hypothetical protein
MATERVKVEMVRRRTKSGAWVERPYDPTNSADVALESSIDDIRAVNAAVAFPQIFDPGPAPPSRRRRA